MKDNTPSLCSLFGTDGIRGRVGDYPIIPELLVHLGYAIGCYLKELSPDIINTVVIGKDTRLSCSMIASSLQSGITAAGINTKLVGIMPTPAIAFLTRDLGAELGIVISASHNLYQDNGIKLFNAKGKKLSKQDEQAIEGFINQPIECVKPYNFGQSVTFESALNNYVNFCIKAMAKDFSLVGRSIVLDCANGATYEAAPKIFSYFKADTHTIGVSPNGLNINDNLGSTSPGQLQRFVKQAKADLGIAFDGDGDRVIFVSGEGTIIDGDQLIYILSKVVSPHDEGFQGIVGTSMTNLAVEHALKKRGFEFIRTDVGDTHVKAKMIEKKWLLGGEASGHIICADATTTGDGIMTALKVLAALNELNMTIEEAIADLTLYPQKVTSIKVKQQQAILSDAVVQSVVQKSEQALANEGRVLIRASGTEPVIRVMVEATQISLVNQHTALIVDAIEKADL